MTISITSTPVASAANLNSGNTPLAGGSDGTASDFSNVFTQLVGRFKDFDLAAKGAADQKTVPALPAQTAATPELSQEQQDAQLALAAQTALTAPADVTLTATPLPTVPLQTGIHTKDEKKDATQDLPTEIQDALAALAGLMATPLPQPVQTGPNPGETDLLQQGKKDSPLSTLQSLQIRLPAGDKAAPTPGTALNPATTPTTPDTSGNNTRFDSAIFTAAASFREPAVATATVAEPTAQTPIQGMAPGSAPVVQSSAPNPAHETRIETPVHDTHWPDAVGEKMVWMSKSGVQQAQITLNPPNLGPLQITLSLSSDQASAQFVSPHAEVRQALQEAMPHLKDMLASSGIALGQSSVGSEAPRQQQDFGQQAQRGDPSRSQADQAILGEDRSVVVKTEVPVLRQGRGMVDLFA